MVEVISELYKLKVEDMLSKSRKQPRPEARQMYWLMLREGGMSYREISETTSVPLPTVYSGVRRISGIIATDRPTRLKYEEAVRRHKNKKVLRSIKEFFRIKIKHEL